jgi:hypothetical protein
MNRPRTIVGLYMLCALAFSAIPAQSATAASKGTTAFTCKAGAGTFKTEHCVPSEPTGGTFGHVAIAQDTTTVIKASNTKTNAATNGLSQTALKAMIAGAPLESTAEVGLHGAGTLTNKKDASTGEHYFEGESTLFFEGMGVTAPAGKGCEVYTDKLKAVKGVIDGKVKMTSKGQGDFVKFESAGAGPIMTYFIECSTKVPAIEGTWELTGSFKCPTNGATIVCSHTTTTEQNTLKGKKMGLEVKMGIQVTLTIEGQCAIEGGPYTPLSFTTVETP